MARNPRDPRHLDTNVPKIPVDDGLGQEISDKSAPVVVSVEQELILDSISKEVTLLSINKEVTSLNSKISATSTSEIVDGLTEIDNTQTINQVFQSYPQVLMFDSNLEKLSSAGK